MEITARLTGDATVSTLKNEKQVVKFNVAINDSYRQKGSTEITKRVTYVQCSYWVNSTIAKYLTKGTLVELQGRIGVNGYIAKDRTAKGSLTFHETLLNFKENQIPIIRHRLSRLHLQQWNRLRIYSFKNLIRTSAIAGALSNSL